MNPVRFLPALATLVVAALATPASAQAVLYRLGPQSSHIFGCYEPCACPISLSEELWGTYVLEPQSSGPSAFDRYRVRNVNWILRLGNTDQRITGSGEYQRGPMQGLHRMELDLSIDGTPAQHYDSGLVPFGAFPGVALEVSQNGFYCYDFVYNIVSAPVPASDVLPYTLRRSGYFEGCYDPCDCALFAWRAGGTFGLVPLGASGATGRDHYALVDAGWHTPLLPPPLAHRFRGFGTYVLDLNAGTHRLVMDLDEGGVPHRLDSGEVAGGALFPRVFATISEHGMVCYDRVFLLNGFPQ